MTATRRKTRATTPPCQICVQRRRPAGQLCLICAIDRPETTRESRKDTR